jgi:hypothetical protein
VIQFGLVVALLLFCLKMASQLFGDFGQLGHITEVDEEDEEEERRQREAEV